MRVEAVEPYLIQTEVLHVQTGVWIVPFLFTY